MLGLWFPWLTLPRRHPGLPAEHGFRIFSGWYGAVRDTMKRVTAPDGKTTEEHLVLGTRGQFFAPPFDNATSCAVHSTGNGALWVGPPAAL